MLVLICQHLRTAKFQSEKQSDIFIFGPYNPEMVALFFFLNSFIIFGKQPGKTQYWTSNKLKLCLKTPNKIRKGHAQNQKQKETNKQNEKLKGTKQVGMEQTQLQQMRVNSYLEGWQRPSLDNFSRGDNSKV